MKNKKFIENIISSIDNILIEGKEQKLKSKLGKEIKDSIFTEDILNEFNKYDFTGIADEDDIKVKLFESIFPVFIRKDNAIFRLYKHEIEVDLSDDMRDRYIYVFSDGRLISGLFESYNLSDDEYVYGVKKIIDTIPLFKEELLITLKDFKENIDDNKNEIDDFFEKEDIIESNYEVLAEYLSKKINL